MKTVEGEALLSDDLLKGIAEIARFTLGDDTAPSRKVIARQIEANRLPIFRLGRSIFARKSSLMAMITEQERVSWAPRPARASPARRGGRR